MLGIEKGVQGFVRQLLFTFRHPSEAHLPSLFIALAVLSIIIGFEIFAPASPVHCSP
jgi:hypothetical protein